MSHFRDRSGTTYEMGNGRWRGDDLSPLLVQDAPHLSPTVIVHGERSMWRYQYAIPIDPQYRVSMGEGTTPLVRLPWGESEIAFKLEWTNPTGSFKDRGTSAMISYLRGQGTTSVLEDSSGNGGSSVAAYAAATGMKATIVVPAATSPSKILQSRLYGASIELIGGTRDDVAAAAVIRSATIDYASHNWHPFFLEGIKTIGYEIWEDLGFRAPDNIVVVAGAGSLVLGCDLAFTDLLAGGHVDKLPRLFVGQPASWGAIVEAFDADVSLGDRQPTAAEGAAIAHPVRLPEVVDAIARSNGAAVGVSEEEIAESLGALARRGLYVEPTSAVAVAALERFLASGAIAPGETTVLILTGSGLKATEKIGNLFS